MKVLAFAASNSKTSINKQLATYAASQVEGAEVEVLDLNDYEMPIFSIDRENESGQPSLAKDFLEKIASCDALIISFAEHNGFYSAAYKNIFDWCSRIQPKIFQGKPTLLMATSPGGRGGATVLATALASMPRFAADIRASLSVPSFDENFDVEKGCLSNEDLNRQLLAAVELLV